MKFQQYQLHYLVIQIRIAEIMQFQTLLKQLIIEVWYKHKLLWRCESSTVRSILSACYTHPTPINTHENTGTDNQSECPKSAPRSCWCRRGRDPPVLAGHSTYPCSNGHNPIQIPANADSKCWICSQSWALSPGWAKPKHQIKPLYPDWICTGWFESGFGDLVQANQHWVMDK